MNYLPAPWVLFIRETGSDWGSDINKLDLERALSANQEPTRWGIMVGGARYGLDAEYKRACHSTLVGPPAQGHLDLSGSLQISFLPLEKRASPFFLSTVRPPTTVRPSFPKLCEASPWAEYLTKPLPLHREAPR